MFVLIWGLCGLRSLFIWLFLWRGLLKAHVSVHVTLLGCLVQVADSYFFLCCCNSLLS